MQKAPYVKPDKALLFSMMPVIIWLFTGCLQPESVSVKEARSKEKGDTVTVRGIITSGAEFGKTRYLQDNTAGISLYGEGTEHTMPGDSIHVTGILSYWNGLLQINPILSLHNFSQGNPLPDPVKIYPDDTGISQYESMVVQLQGAHFTRRGYFKDRTNYTLIHDTFPLQVRIMGNSPLVSEPIPEDTLKITGILSRFYHIKQLLPRNSIDLSWQKGPGIARPLQQTGITDSSFTVEISSRAPASSIFQYGTTPGEHSVIVNKTADTIHSVTVSVDAPHIFKYGRFFLIDEQGDTSRSRLKRFSAASVSGGEIRVFFNNSVDTEVGEPLPEVVPETLPDTLVKHIELAQQTIDIAMYNFNNDGLSANISDALNRASDRGVQVRFIANHSTAVRGATELSDNIPVLRSADSDDHSLMHHKFILFDASHSDPGIPKIWTGSMNLTQYQVNRDPNNVLLIQDQNIALAYLERFNQMWGSSGAIPDADASKFGPEINSPLPTLFKSNGRKIRLFFSPYDPVSKHLSNTISNAKAEVYIATMVLTRFDIANAILSAALEKDVRMLLSVNPSNERIISYIKEENKDLLHIYEEPGLLHHKYFVADPGTEHGLVWTGSHNWSNNAEKRNDENTLIIHCPEISQMYYSEWKARYAGE